MMAPVVLAAWWNTAKNEDAHQLCEKRSSSEFTRVPVDVDGLLGGALGHEQLDHVRVLALDGRHQRGRPLRVLHPEQPADGSGRDVINKTVTTVQ